MFLLGTVKKQIIEFPSFNLLGSLRTLWKRKAVTSSYKPFKWSINLCSFPANLVDGTALSATTTDPIRLPIRGHRFGAFQPFILESRAIFQPANFKKETRQHSLSSSGSPSSQFPLPRSLWFGWKGRDGIQGDPSTQVIQRFHCFLGFLFVMRPHIVTFGPGKVAWLLNKLRELRFMLFIGAQQIFKCHFTESLSTLTLTDLL